MNLFRLISFCLLLCVVSCGYSVPGQGDSWAGRDGRTLKVALFHNQSSEPYLENFLKEEMVKIFSTSRLVELTEDIEAADLVLDGKIVNFEGRVSAYDSNDDVSEYTASMGLSVQLTRRSTGSVYWQGTLRRSEKYSAFSDKNARHEARSLAAKEVSRRLAEDLYARLLADF